MADIANDRLERLKQNLLKLNYKKHKKRVGEARIHLTQYLAHALPMASQRFLLAPIYRSCVASQSGNMTLYNMLRIPHPTPLKILIGLHESVGFKKLWSLSRVHTLSGAIYPGVLIGSRVWLGNSYSNANGTFGYAYMRTVMLCSFAHLFSYPFDVAYGRFASTVAGEVSVRTYLRETISKYGLARLYSGYTICAASTAVHLMVALPLNNHLHGKLKERLSLQIECNPAYNSTIRPLKPRELKPIEMYPWNVIFGSFAAFIARTATYPLDTMRIRYQQETWHHNGRTRWNHLVSSIRVSNGCSNRKRHTAVISARDNKFVHRISRKVRIVDPREHIVRNSTLHSHSK